MGSCPVNLARSREISRDGAFSVVGGAMSGVDDGSPQALEHYHLDPSDVVQ